MDALDHLVYGDDLHTPAAEVKHGRVVADALEERVRPGQPGEATCEAVDQSKLSDVSDGGEGGVHGASGERQTGSGGNTDWGLTFGIRIHKTIRPNQTSNAHGSVSEP